MKVTKKQLPLHALPPRDVLSRLGSSIKGLSSHEVEKRIGTYGLNRLERRHDWFWLRLIINQFNNALVWILLVAAGLAIGFGEFRDVIIILLIIGINAVIGFFQEYKAERVLQKIIQLVSDSALVIRDGAKKDIDALHLVPGDIVFLSAGDNVPADGYLLEGYDLYINDFIFTGESQPHRKKEGKLTTKHFSIGELENMVFMGSSVTRGEGMIVVTATGMQTQLGKLAHLAAEIHSEPTPLQKQLQTLGRQVSVLAILIGILVIFVGRLFGISWYEAFLFALALAVSVVPEGLPAALSVALSLGMKRLLRVNVLAKKLNAVETLGSVTVICTDKTGTLTKNELMVSSIVLGTDQLIQVSGEGFVPKGTFQLQGQILHPRKHRNTCSALDLLFKIGVLCNDADLVKNDGAYRIVGDPTEGAIIVAARKWNPSINRYFAGEKKVHEIPFSSERRLMSVVYQNKHAISYVKGSPEVLIKECEQIFEGGIIRALTAQDRKRIIASYDGMSGQALRVLGFAFRHISAPTHSRSIEEAEKKLVWVGMMGMMDPPRKDVRKAIESCHSAGITVIMITGDYEGTALAIGRETGLVSNDPAVTVSQAVISGTVLRHMSDHHIWDAIRSHRVIFARINPEQKLRLANILKRSGQVIAMTGDGVNDALALKRADIGVAMGLIGTDVAKESADMILLDDNFSSIVRAIHQGRVIYHNIKKFVHYVFTSNASELFTVALGVMLQLPTPLTAIQILATDLGTDLFPSLALGLDPAEPNVMKEKPRDPKERVVTWGGFVRLLFLGLIMAGCAVTAFLWSMLRGGWMFGQVIDTSGWLYVKSTTVTYAVVSMTQMANVLHSRSEIFSPFSIGIMKNRYVIGSIVISVLMLLMFIYTPFFQRYLRLVPIDSFDWMMVGGAVVFVYGMEELRKMVVRASL